MIRTNTDHQIDKFYEEIQSLGGGRWDTSSLLERIKRNE